jgi:hypothetical protein
MRSELGHKNSGLREQESAFEHVLVRFVYVHAGSHSKQFVSTSSTLCAGFFVVHVVMIIKERSALSSKGFRPLPRGGSRAVRRAGAIRTRQGTTHASGRSDRSARQSYARCRGGLLPPSGRWSGCRCTGGRTAEGAYTPEHAHHAAPRSARGRHRACQCSVSSGVAGRLRWCRSLGGQLVASCRAQPATTSALKTA